jgi:ParB family chromosome partitioning protein
MMTPRPAGRRIESISIDRITILNPRVRSRRKFQEIVDNIARIGLKRPITVARREGGDGQDRYDLVCGQGRIEAFVELGQTEIPANIIDADEQDCMIRSLVENCARRQYRSIDILRDVGALRERGYTDRQIADKIGVTPEWVNMIANLLQRGEDRLLEAVDSGLMPISLAVEISKADDEGVQRALTQAYTEKTLKGKKLVAVRRLIEQRQRQGKHVKLNPLGRVDTSKRPLTSEALIRVYRQEADRQKLLIKRAEVTQNRLLFVTEALRVLRADENFVTLLRAEGLDTMPQFLEERLSARVV